MQMQLPFPPPFFCFLTRDSLCFRSSTFERGISFTPFEATMGPPAQHNFRQMAHTSRQWAPIARSWFGRPTLTRPRRPSEAALHRHNLGHQLRDPSASKRRGRRPSALWSHPSQHRRVPRCLRLNLHCTVGHRHRRGSHTKLRQTPTLYPRCVIPLLHMLTSPCAHAMLHIRMPGSP